MADTTNASLTPQAIRLECLRLAQRPDKDTGWITQRAEDFERYVVGSEQPTAPAPATTEMTADAAPETPGKAKATSRAKSS